jgi:hypothetical protein
MVNLSSRIYVSSHIHEKILTSSPCLLIGGSVHFTLYNRAVATGLIYVKFGIEEFYENQSINSKFCQNRTNIVQWGGGGLYMRTPVRLVSAGITNSPQRLCSATLNIFELLTATRHQTTCFRIAMTVTRKWTTRTLKSKCWSHSIITLLFL